MMTRQVTDCWPAAAKVIEFSPRNGALGESLLSAGFRYLGVVSHEPQANRVSAQHERLRRHLVTARSRQSICQNNADVLILQGGSAARLRRFRDVRHAQFVACPLRNGPVLLWTMLFWAGQFLLLRLAWPRTVRVGNTRLVSFRVRRPRPRTGPRRFVPHWLGVTGFFGGLRAAGVRHAVLRWFEHLPQIAPDEDLDLLIDDDALESVGKLLDSGPGIQAVDLYSVYGAPGADYRRLPYYAPSLARQILARSVWHRGLCCVPSPRDHFLSLAYHAVYHKGFASGLSADGRSRSRVKRPEHDYPRILADMARRLALDVAINIADLDAWLDAQGWRPPHDMLVRLARKNRALRPLVEEIRGEDVDAGFAVFLLRREALARGGVKRAVMLIAEHGFDVLETIAFTPDEVAKIARSLRGGNWGAGPWPKCGGEPVAAIVVHDADPIRPTRGERRKFPFLSNARLLKKDAIRDAFNASRPEAEHCNVIHSSDNGREARDYLKIIAPERVNEILTSVEQVQSRAVHLRRNAA
ncbi:MAG: hypothetical protein AB7G28_23575 [Pirellulales bacterium]